ncbi:pyridoxamine 5'-phosphate oxidase family protein [Nocardioides sp.]|uniref:pyridoxamine 5'-phosphate oxidase family protein n=1 Tax=Nocardioides sp. TaxID=35761 RepID=UPI001A334332|nr:pyridoxamine 5'-phosphate oxidase family protein [Nocardioides sp.]MBJ7358592.1 pyridoxamine 5'-phosphate oxidase family protein [Nocardioides sp.]
MDKSPSVQPALLELAPYECWRLLDQPVRIARVVWTVDGAAAIVPVNYAVADGALWFRTTPHSRLAQECPGREVLVEVDSLDPVAQSGWSVIVTGVAESIDGLDVPDILGGLHVWPRGHRPLFLRVMADKVTGRRLPSPY